LKVFYLRALSKFRRGRLELSSSSLTEAFFDSDLPRLLFLVRLNSPEPTGSNAPNIISHFRGILPVVARQHFFVSG